MRILLWHVDAPWTTVFVQGSHDYYVPVTPDRGPDGRGRAPGSAWPSNVREVPPAALRHLDVDVVVLQRPHECALAERWLGRRPGRDVPAVYVEHNTPGGTAAESRHPMADQRAVAVVHVTDLNELFWDCGSAPTTVVEDGVLDPGYRYRGELPRAVTLPDDSASLGRTARAALLEHLAGSVPVDVLDGLPQHELHRELPSRRVYVHTARWAATGRSLIEAMLLGMPVVAVGPIEAAFAVPAQAGVVTTDRGRLVDAVHTMIGDRDWAVAAGRAGREHALAHHGLDRFLWDWDVVLADAR